MMERNYWIYVLQGMHAIQKGTSKKDVGMCLGHLRGRKSMLTSECTRTLGKGGNICPQTSCTKGGLVQIL